MTPRPFQGSFTQQEPIDQEGIAAAVAVLRSGRLHRYNTICAKERSEAALFEQDFATYQGSRYALACASGGYALHLALRATGLRQAEAVLTNAFTLAPVPGAIVNAGGRPVLVEINQDLVIDLEDLDHKAQASGARILVLSYMRGHMPDMDAVMDLVMQHKLILIEDCAHTMGASWGPRKSGTFGRVACFSTQTYKHLNSGEGGIMTSDDPEIMARAIVMSGSYMLYERHGAAPDPAAFADVRLDVPNFSGRMDNVRAALLRVQLPRLEHNIARWNARYRIVETRLQAVKGLRLPVRPSREHYVGSSIQFLLPDAAPEAARDFVACCAALGVEIKWFGNTEPAGFTSTHKHWRYLHEQQSLPRTDAVLSGLFDMRLPLTFSMEDCQHIADLIAVCADHVVGGADPD